MSETLRKEVEFYKAAFNHSVAPGMTANVEAWGGVRKQYFSPAEWRRKMVELAKRDTGFIPDNEVV